MESIEKKFIRLSFIESKTYEQVCKELTIDRNEASRLWEHLKPERVSINKVKTLFNRKRYKGVTFPDFYDHYVKYQRACHYCGITQDEIQRLFDRKQVKTKRQETRGKVLELDRADPEQPYEMLENLRLACYWCNNAKTDEFSEEEFQPIAQAISTVWSQRLKRNITDSDTNFVYLSELLKVRFPILFNALTRAFKRNQIGYGLLPNTKDIWAVDYMPIQTGVGKFVQFKYDPDYLKSGKWPQTKTDPELVWGELGVSVEHSDLVVDGGNIVRSRDKAIMTTKIFDENPGISPEAIVKDMQQLLGVKQVVLIPKEPRDRIGHSDGMVRFIDESRVVLNQYPRENKLYSDFYKTVWSSLKNAGLEIVEMPYTAWRNNKELDACGCYINYLQVGRTVFLPAFGQHEDSVAAARLHELLPGHNIVQIDCSELAKEGGVLNCISWNIVK